MNESAGKARFSKFKAGTDTVESALTETINPVLSSAKEFADKKNIGKPIPVMEKQKRSRVRESQNVVALTEQDEKRQKRTSIIIDLEIYQTLNQLKQSGMIIGEIINEALHDYLNKKYPRYVELAKKIIELQG